MLSSTRSLVYFTIEKQRRMEVAAGKDVVFVGGIFRGQLDSRDEKPEGTLQSSQISLRTQQRSWLCCQVRAGLRAERRSLRPQSMVYLHLLFCSYCFY